MPTYAWLIIIAAILLIWWLWTHYGNAYIFMRDNPAIVGLGQSAARYATDVAGLVNAYQAASDGDGDFMSRMGRFFGALPK